MTFPAKVGALRTTREATSTLAGKGHVYTKARRLLPSTFILGRLFGRLKGSSLGGLLAVPSFKNRAVLGGVSYG